MQLFSSNEADVQKSKWRYGLAFGVAAGFAFAIALWGSDDYILAQHHGLFPWTKLIIGGALSITVCGLAGWLTMRFEKNLLSLLIWGIASRLLAWFGLIVPMILTPGAIGFLRPEIKPYLKFIIYPNMDSRIIVLFVWILITALAIGAIQIPLVNHAVFSTSAGTRILPVLVCMLLFGLVGSFADSLNNQALREPIVQLDQSIQFWFNTRGTKVDPVEARTHRLASLRPIEEQITFTYKLVASGNDELLESVPVLVSFDNSLAQCESIYGNVLSCKTLPK